MGALIMDLENIKNKPEIISKDLKIKFYQLRDLE